MPTITLSVPEHQKKFLESSLLSPSAIMQAALAALEKEHPRAEYIVQNGIKNVLLKQKEDDEQKRRDHSTVFI